MRVVFIGASEFGLKCLKCCKQIREIEVVGVVTAPKIFSISYSQQGVKNVLHADISEYADTNDIPIITIKKSMADPLLHEQVISWEPDAFLVAGWYHMIPKSWRLLAPAYGLHASLLPKYSGGAPLVWAMINGETKTGITLFEMDDGVDSGRIAGQIEEPISFEDTIATLYKRIEAKALILIREILPKIATKTVTFRIQDESKRKLMPQRCPDDGLIDWDLDAETIIRFIRAQTKPYPGAFTILADKKLHIWAAELHNTSKKLRNGQVEFKSDGLCIVYCGTGAIALTECSYDSQICTESELKQILKEKKILESNKNQRYSKNHLSK